MREVLRYEATRACEQVFSYVFGGISHCLPDTTDASSKKTKQVVLDVAESTRMTSIKVA